MRLRTGGTTGRPRHIVRDTTSWVDSFALVADLTRLGPGDRLWLPGPVTTTLNLFAAVLARWARAEVVDHPRRATHTHLTPLALRRSLAQVRGVRVTVAGDRLPAALARQARAAGAVVDHYYGAAELSFVAWGPDEERLRPFPGVEVESRSGELWVRSAYLCQGYADSTGPFRRDADGFATVGDRGRVESGRVVVLGRGGAAVTTGGATVPAADVAAGLQPAVRGDLVVLGTPHDLLGEALTVVLTDREDHRAAVAAARERLVPEQRPRRWFWLPELPCTDAGKVDLDAVRVALHDGRGVPLAPRKAPRATSGPRP